MTDPSLLSFTNNSLEFSWVNTPIWASLLCSSPKCEQVGFGPRSTQSGRSSLLVTIFIEMVSDVNQDLYQVYIQSEAGGELSFSSGTATKWQIQAYFFFIFLQTTAWSSVRWICQFGPIFFVAHRTAQVGLGSCWSQTWSPSLLLSSRWSATSTRISSWFIYKQKLAGSCRLAVVVILLLNDSSQAAFFFFLFCKQQPGVRFGELAHWGQFDLWFTKLQTGWVWIMFNTQTWNSSLLVTIAGDSVRQNIMGI